MARVQIPEALTVRAAGPEDDAGLQALARACFMKGSLSFAVERAPDYFLLPRLARGEAVVIVAEVGRELVGAVTVAMRHLYFCGAARWVAYVGDFRVHPEHRGPGIAAADRLIGALTDWCRARGGDDVLAVFNVLLGNRAMEKRYGGGRGIPGFFPFRRMITFSIPLIWGPRMKRDFDVDVATEADVEQMEALWRTYAPRMQMAETFELERLGACIARAPGLSIGDYLVARRKGGCIAGFIGVWDQTAFRQMRIIGYSPGAAALRMLFNLVGPFAFAARLPPAGGELPVVQAVHACTPLDQPHILRGLLIEAQRAWRMRGRSLLNVALDEADPRVPALRGFLAQKTRFAVLLANPSADYGAMLDDRPFHPEIALA